ncbi:MFS transporter [Chloroflexota bacterium]
MYTRVFWNLWSSYAIYYFGKVNLSLVIPVLLATYGDLSMYNVGMVASGFLIAYAVGQFLHGQISERFNPFIYVAIGLMGSAIINAILGFSAGFFWVLLVGEIIDGGFQSMGWSSIVRANAETSKNPEKSSTILGTAYQAGNSITWIVCAFAIGQFGWQYGFWVASIVMVIRGFTLYISRHQVEITPRKAIERVKLTLDFPIVTSGLSLCLLNMVRYGVIIWIPTYLYQMQDMPIEKVGVNIFLIPIAGIVGTLLYSRIRLHKDVTTIIYLALLGALFVIFPFTTGGVMVGMLIASGFLLYGPHVFLVTTIPSRFYDKKIVAASTGFIDGMGYIGSVLIGIIVPFIIDWTGGWQSVFYFWAALSFATVLLVVLIYVRSMVGRLVKEEVI